MTISFSEEKVNKLITNSMLYKAKLNIAKYQDKSWFGSHSFSQPKYKKLVEDYSVWLDLYPLSTITDQSTNQSVLNVYGNPELLKLLSDLGVKVIHTNPMQSAGSIDNNLNKNKSIDGGYDRIDYNIESDFGTNQQYKDFVNKAKQNDILVAGDVIPGHTGIGPDFILALLNYAEYPSLYVMREIKAEDWGILPANTDNKNKSINSFNVNKDLHSKLLNKNYIPGNISLVMFEQEGVKTTNWSVTEEITGVDGVTRRWLYLHWFKQGQPTLDWLNPGFSAHQLLAGDILQHRFNLGTSILRFDANCLLGLEKLDNNKELLGAGHPLSVLVTRQLAMLMRRLGGYSYEENNAELDNIKSAETLGPDLSYNFALRTGYIHAIATGDASLLKTQQKIVKANNINYQRLIHAMQNHDNLCYELAHFDKYPDQIFEYKNKKLKGFEIKNIILAEVQEFCKAKDLPFKLSFGGIQAHFIELCAARLGIAKDKLLNNNITNNDRNKLKQLMLLTAFYNAMQPGVFQVSAWDLLGITSKNSQLLKDDLKDGDLRWLCRSGFDLLDSNNNKKYSNSSEVPDSYSVFGSLQKQINNQESFLCCLQKILQLRSKLNISSYYFYDTIDCIEATGTLDKNDNSLSITIFTKDFIPAQVNENIYTDLYIIAFNFGDVDINIYKYIKEYLLSAKSHINYSGLNNIQNNDKNSGQYVIPNISGKVFELSYINLGLDIKQRDAQCHFVDN